VKVQRKDHVSKKNFLYRYPAQNEHFADLAVVSAQWCTPTPRCEGSEAYRLRSRRHDGPAAYPAVRECSPVFVIIPLTAAVEPNRRSREGARRYQCWPLRGPARGHPFPRCSSVYRTGRDSTR
jgi:hypothetical protein